MPYWAATWRLRCHNIWGRERALLYLQLEQRMFDGNQQASASMDML